MSRQRAWFSVGCTTDGDSYSQEAFDDMVRTAPGTPVRQGENIVGRVVSARHENTRSGFEMEIELDDFAHVSVPETVPNCFAHEHDIETGKLLYQCPKSGAWVTKDGRADPVYLCEAHMQERGNRDGAYHRIEGPAPELVLRPPLGHITLDLPNALLDRFKRLSHETRAPYHQIARRYLQEGIDREAPEE